MRRLKDERGAVAVMVAVSAVVLMGMAAMVIDVGALYEERRELQNGADAGALAIAQECADALVLTTCLANLDEHEAVEMATSNALDGLAAVDDVDITGTLAAGTVTVETSTETSSGNQITYKLAQILSDDLDGKTVHARAVAAWGNPGALDALPLTISDCLWNLLTATGTVFGSTTTIMFHDPLTEVPCAASNNNQLSPGNWGWIEETLVAPGTSCIASLALGVAAGDTGNDTSCSAAQLDALLDREIGIPVYSSITGTGSNTEFTITGFAGFVLEGYHLGGALDHGTPCANPDRCIRGEFTRFIDHDGEIDPDAEDFGVKAVQLIG